MAKMKTKSAVAKRFKRTGSGKLTRKSPGQHHASLGKSARRKRRLAVPKTVHKGEARHIHTLIPYK